MHSLVETEQARREWIAWRVVCQKLEGASARIDLNNEPELHAALVRWGEEVAELRDYQDSNDRTRWLEEARAAAPEYLAEDEAAPERAAS